MLQMFYSAGGVKMLHEKEKIYTAPVFIFSMYPYYCFCVAEKINHFKVLSLRAACSKPKDSHWEAHA